VLLRPLSARLLKTTRPEREGLVDRERLLNISGRGRKQQMELAARFGITSYPAPAGGCLLTTPGYSRRLRDLVQHRPQSELSRRELDMLKWGRHFRVDPATKIIVGRDQQDNEALELLIRPGNPGRNFKNYCCNSRVSINIIYFGGRRRSGCRRRVDRGGSGGRPGRSGILPRGRFWQLRGR
jgi:hypothetical protein